MKKSFLILLCTALILPLAACSGESSTPTATDDTAVSTSNDSTELSDGSYDLSFSKRDCDSSYDESSAKSIVLSDDSDNGEVTISSEGTYIISGSCTDGKIVVDASDKDKIQLVLDGVKLKSSGAAIVVKNADKVFVTLADNSQNTISDGSSYEETINDTNVDAAIFSKCDLTFNGSGSLSVSGNYKHGIVSKDDLVITDGSITVDSQKCGINGKDCVKIKNGTISVKSGTDAIRSDNDEKTDTKGFVYVADGKITLDAETDGIQASSLLRIDGGDFNITTGGGSENGRTHTDDMGGGMMQRFGQQFDNSDDDQESAKAVKAADALKINGGTFEIDSSDDCFHSNNTFAMTSGTLSLKSGDDGIHADSQATIDGGTINISKSYEGIEAGDIVVNDGTISITSSDDGFNAAGGNDGNVDTSALRDTVKKSLTINGGYITVNASGDGLDSNGTLTITGGVILVSGPTDDNNGAIDYDTEGKITGGVLVALGSNGMAESVTGDGQCTIMTNIQSQDGDTLFALTDSSDNVIVSFKPSKQYKNIVVSTPSIEKGETYKIVCGGTISNADVNGYCESGTVSGGTEVTTITMDSENYTSGGGQFGGGQLGGEQGGGMMKEMPGGAMGDAPDNKMEETPNGDMQEPPNGRGFAP